MLQTDWRDDTHTAFGQPVRAFVASMLVPYAPPPCAGDRACSLGGGAQREEENRATVVGRAISRGG